MPSRTSALRASDRGTAALLSALFLLAALGLAAAAEAKKPSDPEDLFNPLLGVDHSHWLVGPIVRIASEEEVERYLALPDDEQAKAFIAAFWAERNEGTGFLEKSPQQIYEARVAEADKRFSEAAYPGSRSDRGTIYVLYGEPEEIVFDTGRNVGDPTLEVWRYAKDAAPGLDGEKPKRAYRFIELDGETVLYEGRNRQRQPDLKSRRGF